MILVTLGVALLFIIRKKRKEKRLKRLRGEMITKLREEKCARNELAIRTKQSSKIFDAETDFSEIPE